MKNTTYYLLVILTGFALLVSSCKATPTTEPTVSPTVSATLIPTKAVPTFTASPQPTHTPTATLAPLAVKVNGEGITLAEYQAELARYQGAQKATPDVASGTNLATNFKKLVLDELIDQVLLAQEASRAGFVVDEAMLQSRIDQLVAQLGSAQALTDWMSAHGYNESDFRQSLQRAIAAAWMRDQIAATVPEAVEQIHARQILLYNVDQANQVLEQLKAGGDFETLAYQFDPVSGGDLSWFPRGYLLEPALEEAVFQLQPGGHTGVIQTQLGFHILQVIERQPQRPLPLNVRLILQVKVVRNWLDTQRSQSQIEIFVSYE